MYAWNVLTIVNIYVFVHREGFFEAFLCLSFLEAVGISFRNFKSKLEDSVGFRPLTVTEKSKQY